MRPHTHIKRFCRRLASLPGVGLGGVGADYDGYFYVGKIQASSPAAMQAPTATGKHS